MVETLILVRHGKAEGPSPDRPDIERNLTPEGAAALAGPDGFARTFSLMSDADRADARIWASSAVRAHQTAQEVARAIGDRAIEEHGSLWEQENAAFLAELAAADARCVIAVGHIPFMDEMASFLTGVSLSFKPGGAAAIALDPELGACSSQLMWFVQGPRAKKGV